MGPQKKPETKNYYEVNKCRRLMGIQSIEPKKKECLTCGDIFVSEGGHNRMCYPCRLRRHEN